MQLETDAAPRQNGDSPARSSASLGSSSGHATPQLPAPSTPAPNSDDVRAPAAPVPARDLAASSGGGAGGETPVESPATASDQPPDDKDKGKAKAKAEDRFNCCIWWVRSHYSGLASHGIPVCQGSDWAFPSTLSSSVSTSSFSFHAGGLFPFSGVSMSYNYPPAYPPGQDDGGGPGFDMRRGWVPGGEHEWMRQMFQQIFLVVFFAVFVFVTLGG
ncbi:hypothetical protein JCM11491_005129 [Sporobolomyces phaffii]